MARLKTLKDGDETAIAGAGTDPVASEPAPETAPAAEVATEEAPAGEGAAEPVSEEGISTDDQGSAVHPEPAEGLDTNGAGVAGPEVIMTASDPALADAVAPAPADDVAAAPLPSELAVAHAAFDAAQEEYLAQSDKLAAANAANASLQDDLKDRDAQILALTATIAQRDAQIAALGAAPPTPVAEAAIKLPKLGKVLKVPEEDGFAKWTDVLASLDDGALAVVVLADDNGVVQPFAPVVGGKALFTTQGDALLYAPLIALEPESDLVTMRFAVLLDAGGKVLSVCRLGALLIGGGGLSAMIPGNNLRFAFS